MKISRILICLLALVSAAIPTSVQAGTVTWKFTGSVVNLVGDGTYWSDLGVSLTDTVSGEVTFDPDAAGATASFGTDETGGTTFQSLFNPAFATISNVMVNGSSYNPNYNGMVSRLRTNLNTTSTNFGIPTADPYDTFAIDNFELGFQRFQVVRITASPAGNGIIPQTYFPSNVPDLDDLLQAHYYIQEVDSQGALSGLMTYWTSVEQVPEPGMISLLLVGLLGLVSTGNLRRRTGDYSWG